ncbi:hypothetical protein VTJ49DRAFT_5924 [Mycothermus thermophilus]|uniref:Alkyl hydroperoxide reductase subunit C/ Thiol specific antioxidant domain-containing protein n=1 Tax=Humicola insolens TaxID=85995 RepID=A0ABR3VK71_HUMIN
MARRLLPLRPLACPPSALPSHSTASAASSLSTTAPPPPSRPWSSRARPASPSSLIRGLPLRDVSRFPLRHFCPINPMILLSPEMRTSKDVQGNAYTPLPSYHPGTQQACLFRDNHAFLTTENGISIYGLSTDSPKANTTFQTKQKLPYPLICDPQSALIGALGLKKAPGGRGSGTTRGVVVIDKSGKVLAAVAGGPKVTVDAVLEVVQLEEKKGEEANGEEKKEEEVVKEAETEEKKEEEEAKEEADKKEDEGADKAEKKADENGDVPMEDATAAKEGEGAAVANGDGEAKTEEEEKKE